MTADVGDGWASRARSAEDYAALLLRELTEARDNATRSAGLLEASIDHHRTCHPTCWEHP